MKILVTGGHGFIGSHLVRMLAAQNHDITILTKPSSDLHRIEELLPQLHRLDGDLRNPDDVRRCIEQAKPDGIFHLAVSNMQSGKAGPDEELIMTNVLGTANLLDATKDLPYKFFIQTGSFLEYGMKNLAMKESDTCEPRELYGVTKLASTLLGQATARSSKKPILTFRIFTPYGPGMQSGRLVEQVIKRALANEDILLTEPTVTRDFLYVSDIADLLTEGMEKAAEYAGEIFNAGSGSTVTLQTLVDDVLAVTQSKSLVRWRALPTVLYDTALCLADMNMTFARFGWRPSHDLKAGIAATVDWYRSHPHS